MAVHLVCEGFHQGLDERVLDSIVIQYHNLAVLTSPSGGSSSLGAVRSYLRSRSEFNKAVSVEDRNYRQFATASTTWENPAGLSFIWRRHEIENYLLHPQVILSLFGELRALPNLAWAATLPTTEFAVDALLRTIAIPLLANHAAEVLREEIVRQINAIGSTSFSLPRPSPPTGAHVPGEPQWLAAFIHESSRLAASCTAVANLPSIQTAAITERYDALIIQYQNLSFLESGDYLRDMGGHELLAGLSRYLHGLGAGARFSQPVLSDELCRHLTQIYQPNTLFQPDDFTELAAILAQY